MKKLIIVLAAVSYGCGCATNIADLKVTKRDQEVYENPYLKKTSEKENTSALKVAIVSEAAPSASDPTAKILSGNFYDEMDSALSSLKEFQTVPRAEIGAILNDEAVSGLSSDRGGSYKIASVDYVLVYKIQSYAMKKNTNSISLTSFVNVEQKPSNENKYKGTVTAKVSLINTKENIKEFTKSISGESMIFSEHEAVDTKQSEQALSDAVKSAVGDFVKQFAVDYAPPAVVQQTKGDGRVAMINVGKNNGVTKNMKMEFYTIRGKDEKKIIIPFAYGKVLDVDDEMCWVEVDDYENAGVKENHFARVRKDQTKSFAENLLSK